MTTERSAAMLPASNEPARNVLASFARLVCFVDILSLSLQVILAGVEFTVKAGLDAAAAIAEYGLGGIVDVT